MGLRHAADLAPAASDGESGEWLGAQFADREGRDWRVLDIQRLLDAPAFLQAGRSVA